jgi:hypothetical protein
MKGLEPFMQCLSIQKMQTFSTYTVEQAGHLIIVVFGQFFEASSSFLSPLISGKRFFQ